MLILSKRHDTITSKGIWPIRDRRGIVTFTQLSELAILAMAIWGVSELLSAPHQSNADSMSEHVTRPAHPILRVMMIENGQRLCIQRGFSDTVSFDLVTHQAHPLSGNFGRLLTGCSISQDGRTSLNSLDEQELVILRDHDVQVMEQLVESDSSARMALSANGNMAVCVSRNSTLHGWDLSSDEPKPFAFELKEPADRIALNAAGTDLFACSPDGTVLEYELQGGKIVKTFPGSGEVTGDPAISADGHWLALARGSALEYYDLVTGKLSWSYHVKSSDGLQGIAISPDGLWVATHGRLAGLHIIHATTGTFFRRFSNCSGTRAFAFSPSENKIYYGTVEGKISSVSLNSRPDSKPASMVVDPRDGTEESAES